MVQFTENEILFIKLCKGLVQVCDRMNRGDPAYLVDDLHPFPKPLYEAFQSLSFQWLMQTQRMRHRSIFCMVEAARQSVEAVDPDFSNLVDFPDEPLIENRTRPSEECQAWASEYSTNIEREQNQNYIPYLMNEIKRLSLPYSTYPCFRRFVAENPFPSDFDLARFRADHPEIEPVYSFVERQ